MLKLKDLKAMHDKAYSANQDARQRAAQDLIFYYVTQWSGDTIQDSNLLFRGEFNILRKAGRQIMSDIDANPVQVNFEMEDDKDESGADLADGLYRAVDRENSSIEAYEVGINEAIVCGFGAWYQSTEYQSMRNGDEKQILKRCPIHEANNKVFFDPNDYTLDKSEAKYVSYLHAYSEEGYKDLVEDLTGERPDNVAASNFDVPEESFNFQWVTKNEVYYVVDFYHREKVKDTIVTFIDPFGIETQVYESELEDVMDDLIDQGAQIIGEKEVKRWQVTKYIASGEKILSKDVIPGEELPIIPVFGEHCVVEDQEHWEGITRLAKDPQRLRNYQMSYLADIVSLSPRPKPTFYPEQIAGLEHMYDGTEAYPYYLLHRKTPTGEDLPPGPLAPLPEAAVPTSLAMSIELSRQAVADVADPGVPQDIADTDLSGKAVIALQNRVDQQSMVYQKHLKHAKRRDGEVFISIASVINDTPRKARLVGPDGKPREVEMMQQVIDQETGNIITINDISNKEFNVYSEIGPSYSSNKQQSREEISTLIQGMPPGDPLRNIFILKYVQLVDGTDFKDVREYANKQLLLQGIREPETPEEEQLLMAQQQNQQPDANTLLAMAEMEKAKAMQMEQQIKMMQAQADTQIKQADNQIDAFNAETKRFEAQVKATEAQAKTENTRADTLLKRVNATQGLANQLRGSATQ